MSCKGKNERRFANEKKVRRIAGCGAYEGRKDRGKISQESVGKKYSAAKFTGGGGGERGDREKIGGRSKHAPPPTRRGK